MLKERMALLLPANLRGKRDQASIHMLLLNPIFCCLAALQLEGHWVARKHERITACRFVLNALLHFHSIS